MRARLYDFNSRPSARGDEQISMMPVETDISIHAPPRGATGKTQPHVEHCRFQFTPLREGRLRWRRLASSTNHFNSRPSARGDRRFLDDLQKQQISIHAPPRGATVHHIVPIEERPISIHAPPRGATAGADGNFHHSLFQFTPLREGRPAFRQNGAALLYFNSRPSARGDAKDMQFLQIFCSTLTNQHGLTIMPRNLSRLFW